MANNLMPVAEIIPLIAATTGSVEIINTKKTTTPTKLAVAYSSLTNTNGISFTRTSLRIPPPVAVIKPPTETRRKFGPKIE